MRHIQGENRHQTSLLPPSLEDFVAADHPVRVIDALVDKLDLTSLGFAKAVPKDTPRCQDSCRVCGVELNIDRGRKEVRSKRLSRDKSADTASCNRAKPERTRPANSFWSKSSFLSDFPGPVNLSSAKVAFRSNYPYFRL